MIAIKEKRVTIQDLRDIIAREQSSVTTHVAPWVWMLVICILIYNIKTMFLATAVGLAIMIGSLIPPIIAAVWLAVWLKDRTQGVGYRLASKLQGRK